MGIPIPNVAYIQFKHQSMVFVLALQTKNGYACFFDRTI